MPFYKKQKDQLLAAPSFVKSPDYELLAERRTEYQYPVDGWHWYDTLDAAMAALAPKTPSGSLSPRQIRQAMNRMPYGAGTLRDAVEAAVAAGDRDLKDWWEFSTYFERTSPHVAAMVLKLGVSDAQANDLWALGASL